MKRIALIIFFYAGILSMQAQEVILLNYNTLDKKYQKSIANLEHPKKGLKSTTWFNHGKLLQDIYKIDLEYLSEGTGMAELKIYYKEPINVTTEQEGPNTVKILEYERINYKFINDVLSSWERKKLVVEEPLDKAYDTYLKTLELDEKGSLTDRVKTQLTELKLGFMQDGINSYYNEDLKKALKDFEMVLTISDLDMFEGVVDTLIIQYAGIIARELGEYKKAAEHYSKLAELDFGGPSTYLNIKNDYLMSGDSTLAIEIMEKAFEKYPDTINVVANLVDLYIKTKEIQQGLKTVNESITTNPEKGELYYWKGRLLLNTEDEDRIDQALEVYEDAIERNPDLYYVYYDIGFIYFLQGQDIFSQAGLEKDLQRREQINEIGNEKYNSALPNLEKALELNDSNPEIRKETLDVLKRIYYKMGMEDKYNEVNEKLKEF